LEEELIKIPVQISLLADLPPCMRYKVMVRGKKLVVRDKGLFIGLLNASFSECHDLKILTRRK